ncbi:MAG: hypothetical protein K0Q57_1257 [Gammaproteobacteria bacterium]|jgi:hypothetical protein|nr:hypothetical protein [Gammaproteobacteria bacterium]
MPHRPMKIEEQGLYDKYKDTAFFRDHLEKLEEIVTFPPLYATLDSIMDHEHVKSALAASNFLNPAHILIYKHRFIELCTLFQIDRVKLALGSEITSETLQNPAETFRIALELASQREISLSESQAYSDSFSFRPIYPDSYVSQSESASQPHGGAGASLDPTAML